MTYSQSLAKDITYFTRDFFLEKVVGRLGQEKFDKLVTMLTTLVPRRLYMATAAGKISLSLNGIMANNCGMASRI
jgi:hypothetical protein